LLNNKLICALLLLISLLTACNGITGSGNSEISMQSNGPPTNTTSAPTAEPENPTPATGNAVHVARWSKKPNVGNMLAPLGGTLAIANNCLVRNSQDGRPTLLILPYGIGVWDDAKQTFTHDDKVIRIGETIEVVGGTISNPEFLKANGKYDVPNARVCRILCKGDRIAITHTEE
jgi:hypothetical protein